MSLVRHAVRLYHSTLMVLNFDLWKQMHAQKAWQSAVQNAVER